MRLYRARWWRRSSELLVERGEQRELAEIEVDAFPVMLVADVLGEEPAVGGGLEIAMVDEIESGERVQQRISTVRK